MTISILGCGWYGKELAAALITQGNIVSGSTTGTEKFAELSALNINPYLINLPLNASIDSSAFFSCDVLVVSIPPKFRTGQTDSFIEKMSSVVAAIVYSKIKKVIYISSTGVYADAQDKVTELITPLPENESGELLLAAERLFTSQSGFDCTVIRFGGLVGPGRHPGRFFAGKKEIPNGIAPVNLIRLDDAVGVTLAILNKNAFGYTLNACSPDHPSKAEFYTFATRQIGLEIPQFDMQPSITKQVDSVYLSTVLDYQFKISSWLQTTF